MTATFEVRVWGVVPHKGKRGTTYGVRWVVAKQRFRRTFTTAKLADGFRAELLTSIRQSLRPNWSASDRMYGSQRCRSPRSFTTGGWTSRGLRRRVASGR